MGSRVAFLIALITLWLAGVANASSNGVRTGSVIKRILAQHNSLRRQFGAAPLTWSSTLARSAQSGANSCSLNHDMGTLRAKNYGENLAMGVRTWQQAIQLWASERKNYNWGAATFQSNAGHFTQMVWKGTRKIGCAKASCGVWSCRYAPAGNYLGQFRQNIG